MSNEGPVVAARAAELGTETAFQVLARAKALEAQGRDIINLGIGQPDFPTPPNIVEAAVKAARDGQHGYTPALGIPELRGTLAEQLSARHRTKVPAERVAVVPGGKVTMFFAALIAGEPGGEILYPDPGFPIYRSVAAFSGATARPIPLAEADGWAFSAETVLERVNERTRLIILNSPANPTGGVTPRAEVDKLVAGLARYPRALILSDEIYGQMLYDGEVHASLLDYPELADRLILLDGWSKTYAMTGWRLGFSVWPAALMEAVDRLAVNSFSCVNAITQWAGLEAITGPQDAVAEMVAAFDARRRALIPLLEALPGVTCVTPKGAFYAFPNISGTGLGARALQDRLLAEAGVAAIAGTSFGDEGEGYLRLSYANSLEKIEEAVARIDAFLHRNSAD